MRKPLEGLFVVEMTSYWSATTTARFLRDMGARVVRVETPPIGDFCRYYGRSMGMPITAEENPIHDIFNGGKECVALDLKDPKNLKLMQNMLAKADIFITSTRTAGLKKLGLDWETLHAKYPKLVMGQVTGYGINGPLVNRPGIDAIAYFGANGVILDTRTDPDSPPIYPPAGMGDTTTGITLLSGVLAALLAARETGVGDYVMTSLYGTGNFVTAGFATNCNYGYEWPREAHTMSPLGQGYKCRDGRYIYVFVNDYTSVWPKFAKALRLPEEVVTDPRFTTKESTTIIANRSALVDIIREYALQRDAQDVLDVEGFAEDGEVALVLIDEDLHELAVLRLERLAHGALREAGARPGVEVLRAGVDRGCDPVAGAVERGGHIIALTGTLAGKQRRHDRAEQRHAGRQVAHAGRRADRGVVRIQAQVGDQAVHGEECHGVQAGGSGQRAVLAAVAGGVRHDQARVFLFQGVIVQVVLFQTAETHARQEYVRLGEHVVQHALVLGIVEIHVHEFLAAVEEVERGVLVRFDRHAAGAAPVANRVARFAGLDLDDSGAEAAQKLTCGGGGPIGRQLHDEKTFEWFIHIVSTSCIFQSILIARTKDNKNARK